MFVCVRAASLSKEKPRRAQRERVACAKSLYRTKYRTKAPERAESDPVKRKESSEIEKIKRYQLPIVLVAIQSQYIIISESNPYSA